MWQADRLHAFGVSLSGGTSGDAGGLARSGGYTPLNQSISRVVINLFTLTHSPAFPGWATKSFYEQSLKCFELLSMDERLATVSEVEGQGRRRTRKRAFLVLYANLP
jgi:hypothetical protein